jgi:hypothetical protein
VTVSLGAITYGMKAGRARRSTRGQATVNTWDESVTRAGVHRDQSTTPLGSVGDRLTGPSDRLIGPSPSP